MKMKFEVADMWGTDLMDPIGNLRESKFKFDKIELCSKKARHFLDYCVTVNLNLVTSFFNATNIILENAKKNSEVEDKDEDQLSHEQFMVLTVIMNDAIDEDTAIVKLGDEITGVIHGI